jgi:uncharacterized protein YjbJ (UPF0337 family)
MRAGYAEPTRRGGGALTSIATQPQARLTHVANGRKQMTGNLGSGEKGDPIMAEEREKLEGKAKEAMGKGREQVGKMSGDEDMETEGQEQQGEGKGQQMAAGIKGKAEEAADTVKDKADDLKDKISG